MSFVYQPSRFAPDPWPVDGPAELSDNEYAEAIATIESPYISNILSALGQGSGEVIVWMLFLGKTHPSDPDAAKQKGEFMQGYYIRAVVRDRQALRRQLEPYGGLTGSAQGSAGQLALSLRMLPLHPDEERVRVVGWGFADK